MPLLSNPQLLNEISNALFSTGWSVLYASSTKPFRLIISKNHEVFKCIIYIYNISHGGNTRDPEEYRIQIKIRNEILETEPGWITLILGWWEEGALFAGWDASRHPRPRYSSSLQVPLSTLRGAEVNGIAISQKENEEFAVAFTPALFMTYVVNVNKIHGLAEIPADIAILNRITQLSDEEAETSFETDELIEKVTEPRREVVRNISTKLRETDFRKRVLNAYDNRCAFCGLQIRLVEAAHILPVSYDTSTDETSNGIALCVLHHRAYDNSFVTFDINHRIIHDRAKEAKFRENGLDGGLDTFLSSLRTHISLPPSKKDHPNRDYISLANQLRGW